MKRSTITVLFTLLVLSGCRRERPAPPEQKPAVVTVTNPVHYEVQDYYEYNGNLEAMETVQIRARVKGFLKEVPFTEGSEVKKGDLLFLIDAREYAANVKKAEADLLKAKAEASRASSEAERGENLAKKGALSTEELDQRMAAKATAEAVRLQSEALLDIAKLELSYTEIRAPISGRISRTLVTPGNLVGQGESTLLTTIVKMDPIYVYFDAPERELVESLRDLKNRSGMDPAKQVMPVEVGVTSEEGYPHVGKIDFRENKVDVGTGTVRMRGQILNPRLPPGDSRLLYPGLYARVRVPKGEPRKLAVVPEDAIMTGQEGRYVYVVDKENKVEKRSVNVGPSVWKGPPPEKGTGWQLIGTPKKDKEGNPIVPAPKDVSSVVAIEGVGKAIGPGDRIIINGLTRARPGADVDPELEVLQAPRKEAPKKDAPKK